MTLPVEAIGDLSVRFKLVNALPAAFLVCLIGVLTLSGAPLASPDFGKMVDRARDYGWTGAAISVAVIAVGALLLEPFELASIRLLEGYWAAWGPMRKLGDFGRWMQTRRRDRLMFLMEAYEDLPEAAEAQDQLKHVPAQALLPTSLGNRLRAFEERAGAAYGIPAIDLWPRLHYALPEAVLSYVNMHRNQLDTACRLCLSLATAGVGTFGLLIRFPLWWWLPLALVIGAVVAYRATLAAAENYGVAARAAIDVYRLRLYQEMRVQTPADTAEERTINDNLRRLWMGDNSASVRYAPTDSDMTIVIEALHRFTAKKQP